MINNRLLTKATLSTLSNWDPKFYQLKKLKFNLKYDVVTFNKISLHTKMKWVEIENNVEYSILGVRSYGLGVYINRTVLGKTLKMKKYQKSEKDHIFWCKVDTKNGAFGIITEKSENSYGSSNMSYLKINTNKIDTCYLQLLFQLPKFNVYMDNLVVGVTNRKYISLQTLLNDITIPLPLLKLQKQLVQEYTSLIKQANDTLNEAILLEMEIESYLVKTMGIIFPRIKQSNSLLKKVNFSMLRNRWETSTTFHEVNMAIIGGRYKCVQLGIYFELVTRSWNKKEHKSSKFNYIEISGIDPEYGIVEKSLLEVNKAPSRATQIINSNDLIIGLTRPNLKKFAIVDNTCNNDICSSAFQVIKPLSKYNLLFLKYILMSNIGIKQFEILMTGALYPAINQSQLSSLLIPLPSLEIQNEIVETIVAMKTKIQALKAKYTKLTQQAKKQFEEEIFGEQ